MDTSSYLQSSGEKKKREALIHGDKHIYHSLIYNGHKLLMQLACFLGKTADKIYICFLWTNFQQLQL